MHRRALLWGLEPSAGPGTAVHTLAQLRTAALSGVTWGRAYRLLGTAGHGPGSAGLGAARPAMYPSLSGVYPAPSLSRLCLTPGRVGLSQVPGPPTLLSFLPSNLCPSPRDAARGAPNLQQASQGHSSLSPSFLSPVAHVPPTPQPHSCLLPGLCLIACHLSCFFISFKVLVSRGVYGLPLLLGGTLDVLLKL